MADQDMAYIPVSSRTFAHSQASIHLRRLANLDHPVPTMSDHYRCPARRPQPALYELPALDQLFPESAEVCISPSTSLINYFRKLARDVPSVSRANFLRARTEVENTSLAVHTFQSAAEDFQRDLLQNVDVYVRFGVFSEMHRMMLRLNELLQKSKAAIQEKLTRLAEDEVVGVSRTFRVGSPYVSC